MAEPQFGGPWTEDRLSWLRNTSQRTWLSSVTIHAPSYLRPLRRRICRYRIQKETSAEAPEGDLLFDVSSDSDAEALRKGSAQAALETIPSFPDYIFIEHNEEHAENLSDLRRRFPNIARRIKIIPEDANVYLLKWRRETDWNKMRAVVFLDPYGMQVEWATIEAMAGTKSIDLWVLFPLGVGVNRFL